MRFISLTEQQDFTEKILVRHSREQSNNNLFQHRTQKIVGLYVFLKYSFRTHALLPVCIGRRMTMNSKEYTLPNGKKAVFEYDMFGIGMISLECMDELMAMIADRPQGEWIDMGDFEQCSVCKGTHLKEFQSYYGKTTWIKTPYCPHCGADMRKERE